MSDAQKDHFSTHVLGAPKGMFNFTLKENPEKTDVKLWLDSHGLRRSGHSPSLAGDKPDGPGWTSGSLAARIVKEAKLKTSVKEVRDWVRDYVAAAPDLFDGVPGANAGQASPKFDLVWSVVPLTTHKDLKTGAMSTDDEQAQLTYSADIAIECDNPAFPKLSWQAVVVGAGSNFNITQISGSVNATWARSFFQDMLKLELVVSAVGGLAPSSAPAAGSFPMVPQVQAGADGKATYTIPGTGKKVKLVFEMNTTATATKGGNPTVDFAPTALLSFSF